jgi:multidrug efflux system membrane fusion protein
MVRRCTVILFTTLSLAAGGGCHRPASEVPPAEAPAIPVSHPVQQDVTDYVDFTGRTDAVQALNVVARVTGYIIKMPFKEGSEVKKDQLLFQIDPRPYEEQLRLGEAQLAAYRAQYKLADLDFQRAVDLIKKQSISQQEYDQYKATKQQAAAQVEAAKASVAIYKLNVDFTRVTSPIDGRVSRYYLTLGNLVNQDQTLLTTVLSQDPMYAYFDTDEPTLLRIRRAVAEGKIKVAERGENPVFMGLQDEQGFPHEGSVNFVNNQVNPSTGSITMRGVFPNPVLPGGVRLLSPGMFVRIRLPIGPKHPALLVIDRAIGSDQGLKYVYVVDAANKVQYRRVTTGPLQDNGLRVIESGLKAGDWVVVGAIQQVRPRVEVRPDRIPMPTIGPSPQGEAAKPEPKKQ